MVFVDIDAEAVTGFGVTSNSEDVPKPVLKNPEGAIKLYDAETGDILYEGSPSDAPEKSELCEEGAYHRD